MGRGMHIFLWMQIKSLRSASAQQDRCTQPQGRKEVEEKNEKGKISRGIMANLISGNMEI